MSLENLIEIQTLTEEKILEVMRSKKITPEVQADIGLKYIKTITSNEMQKLGAIIQVAGLYTPERREEIAKKIIPPMSNIIDPNIQVIQRQELKKVFDSMNQMKQEHAEMGKRVQQTEAEKQKIKQEAEADKQKIKQEAEAEKQKIKQEAEAEKQKIKQEAEAEKQKTDVEKQKLVNVIADLEDDKKLKEAPVLAESIKKDYQLKRDY